MILSFEHLCLLAFFATLNFAKAENDFTSLQEFYVVGKEFTMEWTSVTGYIQALNLVYEENYDDFVPSVIELDCTTPPSGCQNTPNNGSLRYTPTKEGKGLMFLLWWSPILGYDGDKYPVSTERLSKSEIFDFVTQEQADERVSGSSSSVSSSTRSTSVSRSASTATSSSSSATTTGSQSGPSNTSPSSSQQSSNTSQQAGDSAQQSSGGSSDKLSGGAIAGIVIGVIALLLLGAIAALLWRRQRNHPKPQQDDTGAQKTNEKTIFKSELEGVAGLSPHEKQGGVLYNTTPTPTPTPAPAYPGSVVELQSSEGQSGYNGVAASELPAMSGNISNVAELDGLYHGPRQ